jgi:hypothetical protein
MPKYTVQSWYREPDRTLIVHADDEDAAKDILIELIAGDGMDPDEFLIEATLEPDDANTTQS